MVVKVLDSVKHCYSADDGAIIGRILLDAFKRNESISLSFAGISDVTSSFANAAIVSLFDTYHPDWVKSHLSIRDISVSAADVIRRCMANGERKLQAA